MPTALIVDDNSLNSDVLTTLLESRGVTAATLDSPRFIYQTLEQLPQIDLVFLDLEFPNHDGFQVIDELKAYPRLRGVPIIAYSVHTSEIDVARQAGFHSFIGKPLDARRFPEQLERLLNGIPVWEV